VPKTIGAGAERPEKSLGGTLVFVVQIEPWGDALFRKIVYAWIYVETGVP
jgi:hypothetical protein